MTMFTHLGWLLRKLSYLGFLAASFLLLVIAFLGTADVISTSFFYKSIPGTVELSGALLAVLVFLGLAEAQARGQHIVIDIVTGSMGPRLSKISAIVALTIGLVFMAYVAWYTTELTMKSIRYNETALGALAFPLPPFKGLAAFGAWLSAAEFLRQLLVRLVTPAGQPIPTMPLDTKEDVTDV